jgi:uncharacterized protein (UPF0276 family)
LLLGTTLSPISRANDEVLDLIDYFEVPGWVDFSVIDQSPLTNFMLHNLDLDWSLAAVEAIDPGWDDRLLDALRRTQSPWFSIHLGFASEDVEFDDHMHPVSEPLPRETVLERIASNLASAVSLCPVPLLVENLDYCPEGAYEHVCEPTFICEILEMTNCGLLLDIGHLQVSASWLNMTPERYLEQLPLERTVEVHISSPRLQTPKSSRLEDVHQELTERDIELLETVLKRSEPRGLTLEYRRDSDRLVDQLGTLRSILG